MFILILQKLMSAKWNLLQILHIKLLKPDIKPKIYAQFKS